MINGCRMFHRTPMQYEVLQEQNYWLTNLVIQQVFCSKYNSYYYPVMQENNFKSNEVIKHRKTNELSDTTKVKQVVNPRNNKIGKVSNFCIGRFNDEAQKSIQITKVKDTVVKLHKTNEWMTPIKSCKAKFSEPKMDSLNNHYEILSEPDEDIPDIVIVDSIPENELNDAETFTD